MSNDRYDSVDSANKESADPAIAEVAITEAAAAATSEQHRPVTEDDIYLYRHEYYERDRRARRTDKQLGFLFALIVMAFLVLAYRVESNDDRLTTGLYNACVTRVATAAQYNIGREALVQMAVNSPTAPKDPAELAELVRQLRDGLLLPIENCGEPPSQ